jgi:hypothetical protein
MANQGIIIGRYFSPLQFTFAPGTLADLVSKTPLRIKHPTVSAVPASWKKLAGFEARQEIQRQKAEIEGAEVPGCLH